MTPALQLNNVTSGYGGSLVIRGVSLSLAPGEILAVVGKNGMGKTSLLETVFGFLAVRSGRVHIAGHDVTATPPHHKRRIGVAYARQERALFQDLSVRDNLRLGLLDDRDLEAGLERIEAWFPVLTRRLSQRAGTLSGGEQKMLLVARGIVGDPLLFLLDEVTEGLQPSVVDRLAEVLAAMRRDRGTALLVVEQHLPFALDLADRFAVFDRGEIVETGVADLAAAETLEAHMRP